MSAVGLIPSVFMITRIAKIKQKNKRTIPASLLHAETHNHLAFLPDACLNDTDNL